MIPSRSTFLLALACVLGSGVAADTSRGPDFTGEVRPILARHCFKCHGPDDTTRKGGLRLDESEAALRPAKSGQTAIVPGKVGSSELVKRIHSTDPDETMPPPNTKDRLTDPEKRVLERWIADGAKYRKHWAFVPPVKAPLPVVRDERWPRNGIDRFVLARLEQENLRPAPAADPHALVRRVYLDLIGLPPTPAEADAFVADPSEAAYERLVDRLLASPSYGERWGRRWLDLARYADTNGYEKDRARTIWPWRDWVVRALNDDMPFDRFTLEQIAGDLLPGAGVQQRIATGFHRNTMLNEEGGIDPLEFRFHAMTDRVATTGTAWLGLTLGCAQCHTHKYDPIPQRDYYAVMACLNNADEPDMDLPAPGWEAKQRERLETASKRLAELPSRFPVGTNGWFAPRLASATSASGEKPVILDDGSALFAGKCPDSDTYTLALETDRTDIDALRLEALVDDRLPSHGPGRTGHGNFVLGEIEVAIAPKNSAGGERPVKLVGAQADVEQPSYPVAHAIDGKPGTGWGVDAGPSVLNKDHSATFRFEKAVGFPGGTRFVVRLRHDVAAQHLIGRARITLSGPVPGDLATDERRKRIVGDRFAKWLADERARDGGWVPLRPRSATSNLPLLSVEPDDSVFASGDITKSDTYDLAFRPGLNGITAIRLEALPDDRLPHHGPGMAYYEGPKGDFFLGEFQMWADGKPVKFGRCTETYGKNNFGNGASAALAVDGDPQTGWSTAGREGERHVAVFTLAEPLASAGEVKVRMLFGRHYACSLGRFRISAATGTRDPVASDLPPEAERLLGLPDGQLGVDDRRVLLEQFLLSAPELASARKEIEELRRPPVHPTTLVLRERPEGNPRPTFVHQRGEYLRTGDRVEPGVLSAIAPFPAEWPRNRLGLARWLVSTNNPLTARVTVNRQWQAFFSRGIVRTSEDFGLQGEVPTHPELLDWLAVEFMRDGWSLKRLHRLIVLSATYRQSSSVAPTAIAADPENRLLARGPQGRLEAEIIRDAALRVSGLLSGKMGGPGVYPPQPVGVNDATWGGGGWTPSEGEDRYRRALYTFAKRTAPFAMSNSFDAPTGESCIARRDVSNTPLQALTLLNDVFFVEVSQAMGRQLAANPGDDTARIRAAFRRCLTRPPDDSEVASLRRFLGKQRQRFASRELDPGPVAGDGSGDPVERAAWTALARAILNTDEMITKD